jgi:hypothetical protein
MDLEAPPPMLDDGMYPMPMAPESFGGPESARPERSQGHDDAAMRMEAPSAYHLLPESTRPEPPPQEPLRVLPPPPVMSEGPLEQRPAMRPPPHHHPGHHPGMPPPHHHAMHAAHGMRSGPPPHPRAMRGLGDDTPQSASNLLGLALVTVPVGGYVGGRYAGAIGILGGMLAAGGLVNTIRAAKSIYSPPTDSSETIVSATFAVLGLGAAAYLLYRGHGSKTKPFQENKKKTELPAEPTPASRRLRL